MPSIKPCSSAPTATIRSWRRCATRSSPAGRRMGVSREWGDDDMGGTISRVNCRLGETRMRWVLRLIATGDDVRCPSIDLVEICRPESLGDIANLGLTLPEAKQLLASVQRAVVSGQADRHGLLRPDCRSCGGRCHVKDWRGHCIATLF